MTERRNKAAPATPSRPQETEAGYEVGYGRPPLSSRFQPGQCGNPRGRPKGTKNIRTLVQEKLDAKVTVKEGGQPKRMSKAEIGITKLVNRFVETGDPKLLLALMKLQEGGQSGRGTGSAAGGLEPNVEEHASDEAILQWFLDNHSAAEEKEQ